MPRLCDSCLATNGTGDDLMSARNFGSQSAWSLTRLTHEAYLVRENAYLSPYTCVEGFRLETVAWDFMHNVHLGCGRDIFASSLRVLISKGVWDHVMSQDWDVILNAVHMEMHRHCAAHGPPVWVLATFRISPQSV